MESMGLAINRTIYTKLPHIPNLNHSCKMLSSYTCHTEFKDRLAIIKEFAFPQLEDLRAALGSVP
jgi:hypothetical protein